MGELHGGHRQRLRDRLQQSGIDTFAPHEVLELLLFYTIPRADTNPIAHRLIERFGSLSAVLEAPKEELLKVEGIGEASATLLSMLPALSRRYLIDKNDKGVVLETSKEMGAFLKPYYTGINREQFYLVCLDKKRKVLACSMLMEGSLGQVTLDMRDIIEQVVRCSASAVILSHNHTQGFALPSSEDVRVTYRIIDALKMLSVEVVDHIIVARDDFTSLRDSGLFAR